MTNALRTAIRDAATALREVLGNDGIRRIQLGWTFGFAGDSAFLVALVLVAFAAGGPLAVGLVGIVRTAPAILAGPLAGIPTARWAASRVLLAVHLVRGLATLAATAWLVAGGPFVGVVAVAAVAATAGSLVRPIQVAAMPSFAREPRELVATNTATSTGEGIGAFAGPLAAGIAVGIAGPLGAALVGSALLLVPIAILAGLRPSADEAAEHAAQASAASAGPSPRTGPLATLAAGIAALGAAPAARAVLLGFAAQVFVRGLSTALVVVASLELLGMGEPGVGLLGAAYGLGSLAGAVGSMGLAGRRRIGPAFAVALALWGLPLAVIGAAPTAPVAVVALAVSGVANGVLDVAGFTLLQRCASTRARSAVFGLLEAVIGVGVSAGSIVVPGLIVALGPRGALAVAGAILPLVAVASWRRLNRADDEAVVPDRELSMLRRIPIFAGLPMSALERIAEALRPAAWEPGEVVMAEGAAGDAYVIVATGSLVVSAAGREVNRCGPGEGVGEIALLNAVPRTATATAAELTTGYSLSSEDFLAAVAGPSAAAAAASVAAERLARSRA